MPGQIAGRINSIASELSSMSAIGDPAFPGSCYACSHATDVSCAFDACHRVYSLFRLLAVAAAIQRPYATGQSPAFVQKGNRRLVSS